MLEELELLSEEDDTPVGAKIEEVEFIKGYRTELLEETGEGETITTEIETVVDTGEDELELVMRDDDDDKELDWVDFKE
jgi:hypothetical protein